jgi:hypothetical protein
MRQEKEGNEGKGSKKNKVKEIRKRKRDKPGLKYEGTSINPGETVFSGTRCILLIGQLRDLPTTGLIILNCHAFVNNRPFPCSIS